MTNIYTTEYKGIEAVAMDSGSLRAISLSQQSGKLCSLLDTTHDFE